MKPQAIFIPGALAAATLLGGQAFAATDYQYTAYSTFSGSGTSQVTVNIPFPAFDSTAAPAWQTNKTLTGFQFDFKDFAITGDIAAFNSGSAGSFSVPYTWTLKSSTLMSPAMFPADAISNTGSVSASGSVGTFTSGTLSFSGTTPMTFMNSNVTNLSGPNYT
ncbi:MAG: hypothetical protein EBU88_17300, partial [Acidobacteria bacterium]|nr:hypothetical protein [Acidobacteriota bacterium]